MIIIRQSLLLFSCLYYLFIIYVFVNFCSCCGDRFIPTNEVKNAAADNQGLVIIIIMQQHSKIS